MRLSHLGLTAIALAAPFCSAPGPHLARAAETPPQAPAPADSAEAIWGDEGRVFRLLVEGRNEVSDKDYVEGEIADPGIPLHPVPDAVLPPTSPLSDLDLQYFVAHGRPVLVLPKTRVVLKVYRAPPQAPPEPTVAKAEPPARSDPVDATPSAPPPAAKPYPSRSEASPQLPAPAPTTVTAEVAPPPQAPPPEPQAPAPDVQRLLDRAEALRAQRDILGARLFLERAAALGSAEAKYRLAQTYDAQMLAAWRVRGVQPDQIRAESLYAQSGRPSVERTTAARASTR